MINSNNTTTDKLVYISALVVQIQCVIHFDLSGDTCPGAPKWWPCGNYILYCFIKNQSEPGCSSRSD